MHRNSPEIVHIKRGYLLQDTYRAESYLVSAGMKKREYFTIGLIKITFHKFSPFKS